FSSAKRYLHCGGEPTLRATCKHLQHSFSRDILLHAEVNLCKFDIIGKIIRFSVERKLYLLTLTLFMNRCFPNQLCMPADAGQDGQPPQSGTQINLHMNTHVS